MKKLLAVLLCLAMVLGLIGCTQKAEEATAPAVGASTSSDSKFDGQIYVGNLYAQTGNATHVGNCDYHAVLAAATEINNAGGIMDRVQ